MEPSIATRLLSQAVTRPPTTGAVFCFTENSQAWGPPPNALQYRLIASAVGAYPPAYPVPSTCPAQGVAATTTPNATTLAPRCRRARTCAAPELPIISTLPCSSLNRQIRCRSDACAETRPTPSCRCSDSRRRRGTRTTLTSL